MLHTSRTTSIRPTRRRAAATRGASAVLAVGSALAVGLGATGCSPEQPGAAAVVGDRRITTAELSAAVAGMREGQPELKDVQNLERQVLVHLVVAPYVLAAAEQGGVGVSEAEAGATLAKAAEPDPGAVRVMRTALAVQRLGQVQDGKLLTQVQQQVVKADPQINPRFGAFDPQQVGVVDALPNWLVRPTATEPPAGQDPDQPPAPDGPDGHGHSEGDGHDHGEQPGSEPGTEPPGGTPVPTTPAP